MTPVDPTTRTIRSIDIALGPGRQTMRCTLTLDEDGKAEALILASGFGGAETGDPFLRPSWGEGPIRLPASVLPELRQALEALERER